MPFFFASCGQEQKNTINLEFDPETTATLNTDSVTMLISDSGLIRYKVITKTWDVYQQAKEPYSYFPDGVYLEQFDTAFSVVFTIKADTAWNFERKKLWRLKGHVFARNVENETFASDEVFWDQQKQQIYSNVPVTIDRPQRTLLIAEGFKSNQQMTDYEFTNVHSSRVVFVEKNEGEGGNEEKKE